MKRISILGATGSVGLNTLELLSKNKKLYNVIALTSYNKYKALAKYAKKLNCEYAVIANKNLYKPLKKELSGTDIKCLGGEEGIQEVSQIKVDIMVSAIVGTAGLKPAFNSLGNTKILALANKETIISAGNLLLEKAQSLKTKIIPLDSEHNAIFQVLDKENNKNVNNIILTASGGPFLKLPKTKFSDISINDALKHPNWKMGKKITIDSATLINKLLETIEASILFNLELNNVDILIHPTSLIHGIVNYVDGSSHLVGSIPDMKIPISFALNWPERVSIDKKPINFYKGTEFKFFKPDKDKFPSLKLKKK